MGRDEVLAWLIALQRVYAENRDRLTELDAAIGDADHGINMDRGFTAVKAALEENAPAEIGALLKAAAAVLIRTVGGASGPLYGTFFLRAGAVMDGTESIGQPELVKMFEAGIQGIEQRGKAAPGDKTMLDALQPALDALRREGLQAAVAAAEAGMLATVPMQARKGRASYLGARSVGHQDPGATSAWLLLKTAAEVWRA
jgi:phosphoenolpyruvate---glycerone phosphotransferase subunit DhaL